MKKKVGIIKRVFCIGLIFLISINSFAAVVSDNDGSAFITKAEFDSLKNNFQAQIDQYNQSIDAKIDGAIASYLSGIKLDGAKKFITFGPDFGPAPHYWMGVKSKFMRLRNVTSSAWSAPGGGQSSHIIAENLTRNNDYGIGSCWWVIGYHPSSGGQTLGSGADAYILASPGSDTSIVTRVFKTDESQKSSEISYSDWKWIANKDLSLKMNSIVAIVRPEIPLIRFLDAGEATIKVWYADNGYNTEGGTAGGGNGPSGYLSNGTKLSLLSGASWVDYTYDSDTWTTITVDAKAGDMLYLRDCVCKNTVGYYGIYFWSAEIPGWENNDEP